jgi:radical SAM-linked protein
VLRTIGALRRQGRPRAEILAAVSRFPGIYVPSYYRVDVEPRTGLEIVVGRTAAGEAADAPMTIHRTYVRDLGDFKFPTTFPVPYAEAIFDRASVEITRGCTEGCRFCQAGMIYRPVRERTPEDIVNAVLEGVDAAGFDATSLTALSTADVSCIDPLIKTLVPELAKRKVSLGIASLRAYGLNEELIDEIKKVGIDGLTFAPEAGTQRMRDVINKNVSEADILASARRIFERGYDRIKMYFIMGLPTETDEDVDGIVETGWKVKQVARELGLKRIPKITCSVSQHVPKPHTPFQWAAMASLEELDTKLWRLRDLARRHDIALKTHEIRESWLECLFSRGDRRMGEVLEWAYLNGARFDGWRECFRFDVWLDALAQFDVKPETYTQTLPVGPRLPWSHLDVGLEDGYLEGEWRKAVKGRVSPPCGKPMGAKVHHTTVAAAQAETKRLVCYDCGVACDLSEMREERLVALRSLSARTEARELDDELRVMAEAEARDDLAEGHTPGADAAPDVVPADRLAAALKGRLAPSLQAANSAFKSNAEAPYSRLRVTYAKRDNMAFMSHLDLVRVLPRAFRRAGIELAFTRGYSAKPRLSFGPALALGMTADAEVLEVDVILDRSAEDMAGFLDEGEREVMERDVLARLRGFAPPGLDFVDVRLVRFGEMRIGELVAGAEYALWLDAGHRSTLEAALPGVLAGESLVVERVQAKKGRGKRVGGSSTVDIRPLLLDARVEGDWLRFRVRLDPERGSVRPRELVKALLGAGVPDHHFRRVALLTALEDGSYVPLSSRTFTWRPEHRRIGEGSARFGPAGPGRAADDLALDREDADGARAEVELASGPLGDAAPVHDARRGAAEVVPC